MLIGISGRMGNGKDTAAEIIKGLDPSFEIKRFAGKLKEIASLFLGIPADDFNKQEVKQQMLGKEWSGCQEDEYGYAAGDNCPMTVREFLQKLGTDAVRDHLHKNAWVNALFADYKERYVAGAWVRDGFKDDNNWALPNWVVPDVRFTNEFEAIKSRGGIVVRIERGVRVPSQHVSETELDNAAFDWYINNNGSLEELTEKIKALLSKIKH